MPAFSGFITFIPASLDYNCKFVSGEIKKMMQMHPFIIEAVFTAIKLTYTFST
jgi:hypothetical protein